MNKKEIIKNYQLWIKEATVDEDVVKELQTIISDYKQIEDAFYRDLAFGTGGLRGVIGAGTNRMNVHTVAKVSQGLSDYINKKFNTDNRKVAVSYDSRIKSDLFAQVASGVLAANGIEVFIFPELMPTPCLSFAVRQLGCVAGIMITASHNPAKYNGYKVYGSDGCQITTDAANEIYKEIEKLNIFADIKEISYETGLNSNIIQYIPSHVYNDFVEEVKNQTLIDENSEVNKNVSIIYTPLNGTGLKPIIRTLKEAGYTNITVVEEQKNPDGNFPTCTYPNPENQEAMLLGIEYAKSYNADLLLATDPDCDRVGIALKDKNGKYVLLSGNETGLLLLDYICSRRLKLNKMPKDPVFIKTIVTIDMAERIAAHYGVRTINVLTGFKFIGEQISVLEKDGKEDSFIFGFEESYGYLSAPYVRDKDAVNGAFLICEMFAFYKSQGISLLEKLEELYDAYGYCLNTLYSYEFDGATGFKNMKSIMVRLRGGLDKIGGKKVITCLDFARGLNGLPNSDVLKFMLQDNCSVVVRPSGTEPKLKIYISVSAKNREIANELDKIIAEELRKYFLD